jgi:ABC-type molybdenum transport system ATPase subunit/photorepair protein PhrA
VKRNKAAMKTPAEQAWLKTRSGWEFVVVEVSNGEIMRVVTQAHEKDVASNTILSLQQTRQSRLAVVRAHKYKPRLVLVDCTDPDIDPKFTSIEFAEPLKGAE